MIVLAQPNGAGCRQLSAFRPDDRPDAWASDSLEGFSGVGTVVVALLPVTGAVNSWFLVGPANIAPCPGAPMGNCFSPSWGFSTHAAAGGRQPFPVGAAASRRGRRPRCGASPAACQPCPRDRGGARDTRNGEHPWHAGAGEGIMMSTGPRRILPLLYFVFRRVHTRHPILSLWRTHVSSAPMRHALLAILTLFAVLVNTLHAEAHASGRHSHDEVAHGHHDLGDSSTEGESDEGRDAPLKADHAAGHSHAAADRSAAVAVDRRPETRSRGDYLRLAQRRPPTASPMPLLEPPSA